MTTQTANGTEDRATVIALCSQKGGVGKTSLTVGLADVLARQGHRVLVVDLDPQANATDTLGVAQPPLTVNDMLALDESGTITPGGVQDAHVRAGEAWGPIDVVASKLALAAREQDTFIGRENRLRTAFRGALHLWDVILVDCPPSLGNLTIAALVAADQALMVTEARATSFDGLAPLTATMSQVRDHFNPSLRVGGIAVNRYRPDRRDRVTWAGNLREHYGDHLIEPFVPEREVVSEAASAAAPLSAYGTRSKDLMPALDAIAARLLPQLAAAR